MEGGLSCLSLDLDQRRVGSKAPAHYSNNNKTGARALEQHLLRAMAHRGKRALLLEQSGVTSAPTAVFSVVFGFLMVQREVQQTRNGGAVVLSPAGRACDGPTRAVARCKPCARTRGASLTVVLASGRRRARNRVGRRGPRRAPANAGTEKVGGATRARRARQREARAGPWRS